MYFSNNDSQIICSLHKLVFLYCALFYCILQASYRSTQHEPLLDRISNNLEDTPVSVAL